MRLTLWGILLWTWVFCLFMWSEFPGYSVHLRQSLSVFCCSCSHPMKVCLLKCDCAISERLIDVLYRPFISLLNSCWFLANGWRNYSKDFQSSWLAFHLSYIPLVSFFNWTPQSQWRFYVCVLILSPFCFTNQFSSTLICTSIAR